MQLKKLKALVKQGESNSVEFKTSSGQLTAVMKTICAFLNQDGGTALFGVSNDGKIIGQEVSDKTMRDIANELGRIEPNSQVKIERVAIGNGKQVIALIAREGKNKPYSYDGRHYSRNQSTTQVMSRDLIAQLMQENPRLCPGWDSLSTHNCTIYDLDKKRIDEVVRTAIAEGRLPRTAINMNTNEILKKFGLLDGEKLTNAAVLLFCEKEEKQFNQSTLRMARFMGTDKRHFLDQVSMQGNIFDLYEGAMKFVRGYLPVAAKFEEGNPFRINTPAIPYKVLREALVNALCHRDYSMPGGSTYIAFYDDRVEIISAGKLPPDITVSALSKRHESYPRNHLVAKVLFACGMIEQWGTGTYDMIQACKESENPIPIFEETSGSFSVTLPLKEPVARLKLAPQMPDLTRRQKEIIDILRSQDMSSEQILDKMKEPPSIRMLQIDLRKLNELNLISQAEKGKGRSVIWTLKRN